ncbi:MAG TPA: DUF6134 family protein [Gemmatimonadales bacterium]|nr:DUF6134 family protein [Gemmatimonadales bacterium]
MAVAIAAACLTAASRTMAQEVYDAGVFLVRRGGAEAGREEYTIRATSTRGGRGILAVSRSRVAGRALDVALELTGDQQPVSFTQTEVQGGTVVGRYSAQIAGIRFSARISSQSGESSREFPVRAPLLVLGDDTYVPFYFAPRTEPGTPRAVSVVRPQDARAASATVESLGSDTVTVGGRQLAAEHFVLRIADGDERHFWFTANGDLVRVAVPATQTVATRAELNR